MFDNDSSSVSDDHNQTNAGQQAFRESIEKNAGKEIDKETQEMLNKPFSAEDTALTEDDKAMLENLAQRVDSGDINLYSASSILNEEVYNALPGEQKSQADIFSNSILSLLRQIMDFHRSELSDDSDMMISMIKELRLKKETLEKEMGDVLKI